MSISESRLHRVFVKPDSRSEGHRPHASHHHVQPPWPPGPPSEDRHPPLQPSYKETKQAFVSDLTGSSIWTINAISLTALTTYALWAVLRSRRIRFVPADQLRVPRALPFLSDSQLEFAILVLPMLGANTVLARYALLLNAILAAAALVIVLRYPLKKKVKNRRGPSSSSSWRAGSTTASPTDQRVRHRRHWSRKSSDEDEEEADEDTRMLLDRGGSMSLDRSHISPLLDYDDNFRVSIESAADAAHAAAAPPTTYEAPSHALAESSRSHSFTVQRQLSRSAHANLLNDRLPSSRRDLQEPFVDLDQPITLTTHPALPSVARKVMTHASTLSEPVGIRHASLTEWDQRDTPLADKSSSRQPSWRSSTLSSTSSNQRNDARSGSHATTSMSPITRVRAEHHASDQRAKQSHGRRAASDGYPAMDSDQSGVPAPFPTDLPSRSTSFNHSHATPPGQSAIRNIEQLRRDSATPSISDSPYDAEGTDVMPDSEDTILAHPAQQRDYTLQRPSYAADMVRTQPFLTVYRSHMMLMTIICILAVDFPVFPRELAKCETWGTSLMDLGVGSFVFSLGLVSALPFLRSPSQRFKPMQAQLLRDLRKSAPVLALGFIRVVMVKSTEYPEHISEYGVHWNFFITLGLLPIAGTLCRPLARVARFSIIGLLIGSAYQILLWTTRLQEWAISNGPRFGLVEQNKEGLSSLPGYLAIFLLGLDLGHYVLPRDPYLAYRRPSRSRRRAKTDKLAMVLASFAVLWWSAYGLICLTGARPSRRLANLSYVLWIVAFNTTFLLAYVCIYWLILQPIENAEGHGARDSIGAVNAAQLRSSEPEKVPVGADPEDNTFEQSSTAPRQSTLEREFSPSILVALNTHAFSIFLLSNLLTGLVNITIPTMYTPHALALAILAVYLALCTFAALEAQKRNWRLRF